MLPSRGLSRCLTRQRLDAKPLLAPTHLPRLAAGARQFGTTLRTNVGSRTLRLPQTAGLVGGARRTAVAVPGAAAAAAVSMFAQGNNTSRLASALQVRNASTTPSPAEAPAVSTGTSDPSAIDTSSLNNLFDGSRMLDMPDHIGYLKELGLDFGWGPSSMVQWSLEHIHVWTGLPWWASIAAFAVGLRIVLLKPAWTAYVHSNKLQLLRKDPKHAADFAEIQSLISSQDPDKIQKMTRLRARTTAAQKEAGIQLWKTMLPMLQVPIGFGAFRILNNAAKLPVPSFETGGLLWFTDLTSADPYYILPMVSAGMLLFVMRSLQNSGTMDPSQAPIIKLMQYVFTPITFLVTLNLSAGVQIYLVVSSFLQIVQTWVQNRPAVRKYAGLPPLGAPVVNPASQVRWEAPRTINTTATIHTTPGGAAEAAADVNSGNPITNFKNAWKGSRDKISGYTQSGGNTKAAKEAEKYEEQRREEEREKYFSRQQAAMQRRKGGQ